MRIILLCILLTGCGGVVTKTDWEEAENACDPFGGIEKVFIRGTEVKCANGQVITGFNSKGLIGDSNAK